MKDEDVQVSGNLFLFTAEGGDKSVSVKVFKTTHPRPALYVDASFLLGEDYGPQEELLAFAGEANIEALLFQDVVYYEASCVATIMARRGAWKALSGLAQIGITVGTDTAPVNDLIM